MPESTIYRRIVRLEHQKVFYYVYSAGEYKGKLKENIHQFKFHRQKDLGRVLGERIYENLPENFDFSDYDCLLPIPSKPSSLAQCGYDHVHLIGERLSKLCGLPLARDILEVLDYPSQTGRNRKERLANAKGKILLIDPSRVIGKNFLVLDDVLTTGTTMDEVIRTLSAAAPGKLDALVLARTTPPWE